MSRLVQQNAYAVPAGVSFDVISGARNIIENFWPDEEEIRSKFRNRIRHLNETADSLADSVGRTSKRSRALEYQRCLEEFERMLAARDRDLAVASVQPTKEIERWAG